jgi:hypothetical protein
MQGTPGRPQPTATSGSYGLRERGDYMRRVQADPENTDTLRLMWRKFNQILFTSCCLLVATGSFGVLAHPAALGEQPGSWRSITVGVLFLAFAATSVWGLVTNYQNRHWISVQAKLRWESDRRLEASQHPWPAPSGRIEY